MLARGAGPQRLVNRTRGSVLAARVEPAFDSRSRRKGLLGRASLPGDVALAIAPSNAVHTFGMQFPIDILFVSRDGRVVKRVLALGPYRIAAAWWAFGVLEFAAGNPGVADTLVGDWLQLEDSTSSA